ncbi:MAG: carboxymuconolactone decarboxylase family protein [Gammaproteobacteria bacterium]|nr:carboxymuconolactone decarboxylase family protein [Gammaproteobacteria bacterium]
MAHVSPRPQGELDFLEPVLADARRHLGFLPNSLLTMAHMPHVALAFGLLMSSVRGGDLRAAYARIADHIPPADDSALNVEPALLQLAAFAVSVGAGCRYCQAHTSHTLETMGVPAGKVAALLNFETSEQFDARERAVVALALAAAQVPSAVNEQHFTALREFFSDRQIVQLVSMLSLFGFLNRWNDTLATALEGPPREFAASVLAGMDWEAGKHR